MARRDIDVALTIPAGHADLSPVNVLQGFTDSRLTRNCLSAETDLPDINQLSNSGFKRSIRLPGNNNGILYHLSHFRWNLNIGSRVTDHLQQRTVSLMHGHQRGEAIHLIIRLP